MLYSLFDNTLDSIPFCIGKSTQWFHAPVGGNADYSSQFTLFTLLLFNTGSVCHNGRKIIKINGTFIVLIDIAADHNIVNTAKGDIN